MGGRGSSSGDNLCPRGGRYSGEVMKASGVGWVDAIVYMYICKQQKFATFILEAIAMYVYE